MEWKKKCYINNYGIIIAIIIIIIIILSDQFKIFYVMKELGFDHVCFSKYMSFLWLEYKTI